MKKSDKKGVKWLFIGLSTGIILAAGITSVFGVFLWKILSRSPEESVSEEGQEEFSEETEEVTVEKAASCDALKASLQEAESKAENYRLRQTFTEEAPAAGGEGMGDSASLDYSQTNVQVEGIDEGDVIKNDGQFAYYVRNSGDIEIARIYPDQNMKWISKISSDSADYTQIYIYGGRLVVIGSSTENYYSAVLEIWDVSSKAQPKLIKGWLFDSFTVSSRMVEGEIYLVLQKYAVYAQESADLPTVEAYGGEERNLCECEEVWIPDTPWGTNYLEIVGLDLDRINDGLDVEVSFGFGDTVYMSPEHLFVAGEYYDYPTVSSDSWWNFWDTVSYPTDPVERTFISKFDYGNGAAEYLASGQLTGSILNQFSMDEYGTYLRVAVTRGRWTSETTNAAYVLDEDLEIAGKVTGIAEGEEIYSVRFIGSRGYVVTFEQMDPLFVIDFSDPEEPEILGELHIPGYSDYLHPWGENYLIGFGMETSSRYGWVETDGVKIAVFDISDPTSPDQISKLEIGGTGSTSDILYDHKALLVNEEAGWFALPIYEQAERPGIIEYGPGEDPTWNAEEFQGLYLFDVDSSGNVSLRGKVTHHSVKDVNQRSSDYETYFGREIRRGLYVDSILYAISDEKVTSHNLSNLNKRTQVKWSVPVEEGDEGEEDEVQVEGDQQTDDSLDE